MLAIASNLLAMASTLEICKCSARTYRKHWSPLTPMLTTQPLSKADRLKEECTRCMSFKDHTRDLPKGDEWPLKAAKEASFKPRGR